MALSSLSLRDVSFSYPKSPGSIIRNLSVNFPAGFTGVVGANGAGKTTLLKLAVGRLQAESGTVGAMPDGLYCAQRTDHPPDDFGLLLEDTGAAVYSLRSRLGIEYGWLDRWPTLSHGERKRAQICVALWREPSVLAIDEPTNHLDEKARRQLIEALAQYRGVGLLVSHDRGLLDELCAQCLWLGENNRLYPGGYTAMQEQRALNQLTASRERSKALRERAAVRREQTTRREQAQQAHRARSKRGIAAKDHSEKAAVNARKNTDSKDGQRLRQLDGRALRAEQAVHRARVEKSYAVGIELPGTVCRRDSLLQLPAGELALGDQRTLRFPDLRLRPTDRVALTGENGAGKSTLLTHIQEHPNIEPERVVIMPQEISAERSATILNAVKSLPREALGHAMSVVSSLGSSPSSLLDSIQPSPGELRKLLLALGMTRRPYLLIMDEPTNHLDLPSIEALEQALKVCACGMLLASHDERFLTGLTDTRWHIDPAEQGSRLLLSQTPSC